MPKDKVLYHYTDNESAKKIKETGMIKQSGSKGDAAHGPGTYFTSMTPKESKERIAANNYDDGKRFVEDKLNTGKVDSVVAVNFPEDDAKLYKCPTKNDVYLYKDDVSLHDKKYAIGSKDAFAKQMKQ